MISETVRVDGEHLDLVATLETPDARQEVLQSEPIRSTYLWLWLLLFHLI
jgi:hypothetical protein